MFQRVVGFVRGVLFVAACISMMIGLWFLNDKLNHRSKTTTQVENLGCQFKRL